MQLAVIVPQLLLSVAARSPAGRPPGRRARPAAPDAGARRRDEAGTARRDAVTSGRARRSGFNRRSFVARRGAGRHRPAARRRGWATSPSPRTRSTSCEAESNRVNLTLIPPRRGWILDRNGSPLASNRADFRVDLIPERLVDPDAHDRRARPSCSSSPRSRSRTSRTRSTRRAGSSRSRSPTGSTGTRFAAVSVRLPDLPGVVPQRGFSRYYPTGPAVGHLIGYVGAASAEEYEAEPNPLLITPGFKIGKDGLEKQFEQRLRGVPGARRSEVTAGGPHRPRPRDARGRPGQADPADHRRPAAGLRRAPARARESGSVVVLDCLTGDLLCMASMPSFDPEQLLRRDRPRRVEDAQSRTSTCRCATRCSRGSIRRARRSSRWWR